MGKASHLAEAHPARRGLVDDLPARTRRHDHLTEGPLQGGGMLVLWTSEPVSTHLSGARQMGDQGP